MVMVPGERQLELTLTLLLESIVYATITACQLAKGAAQGSNHVIARSEMGAGQSQNWVTM